jgi:hypothetical protein
MDGSDKQLNRECSLFCNDGKHVIIGAAILISDEQRPYYELYTNNEFISTVNTASPTLRIAILTLTF